MIKSAFPVPSIVVVLFCLSACEDKTEAPPPAGGPDGGAGIDTGRNQETDTYKNTDTNMDTEADTGTETTDPVITECPGPPPASSAAGTCSIEKGVGSTLHIIGNILTPGEVFRRGHVVVDASGNISCVGCDCVAPDDSILIDCPNGVVSPGLINAHDHITYVNNHPAKATDEKYEHRHQWRRGLDGHTEISVTGRANAQQMLWGEMRMVMGGATSINGSGSVGGFLRNLDRSQNEGIDEKEVNYSTFPLGDGSDSKLLTSGCAYPRIETAASISKDNAYTPHISEGINTAARNEFLCVREGATDLVQEQSAFIHGIGLKAMDIAEMSLSGTDLIWSPRSNISLYGDTARVSVYHSLGVSIALGTDWIASGSMNMIRELQCADFLNEYFMREGNSPLFSDEDLWLMATRNAARALGVDRILGTLQAGKAADIAIYNGETHKDHRAVIDARPEDVLLVLRRTEVGSSDEVMPLYGDAALVTHLPHGDACDTFIVCGTEKAICVSRETGGAENYDSLSTSNKNAYPLFYCGEPDSEPSCLPSRNASRPIMSPEVSGSNVYDGQSVPDDLDGDGILNAEDNCPAIFNPIRPMDSSKQADFDLDETGDACDPCPLHPGKAECPPLDVSDLDGDGILSGADNCPGLPNPDQTDSDGDSKGDLCDPCPDFSNPGAAACRATIYDLKVPGGPYGDGQRVEIHDALVTGVGYNGFYVQEDPSGASYRGPQYSGIFVYTATDPTANAGDKVDITGELTTYNCQRELVSPSITTKGSGFPLPSPVPVTTGEIQTGSSGAEELEGVRVIVSNSFVTDINPSPCMYDTGENEFEISDGSVSESVLVDDYFWAVSPPPQMDDEIAEIQAILANRYCCSKLEPVEAREIIFATARLGALEPELSFANEGESGPTFPNPLTVSLKHIVDHDVTVHVFASTDTPDSSVDGGVVEGDLAVADVVIQSGDLEAAIPVVALLASTTPVMVSAELGDTTLKAAVRIVGDGEVPVLENLQPSITTISLDKTLEMEVSISIPAPSGGTLIQLETVSGGSVPPSVIVPENHRTAVFVYTAPSTPVLDKVTATCGIGSLSATIEVIDGAPGGLVINEVDYDNIGTDSSEFVELFNASSNTISLDNLAIVSFNGANSLEADRWPLGGNLAAGEFMLLAGAGVTIPDGVLSISLPKNSLQNGSPDGLALFDLVNEEIVDALSYEGAMTSVTVSGVSETFNLVEGTATSAEDSNSFVGSLIRFPDGTDTNNATGDWSFSSTPTPGQANIN